jgi:hypothetical protein
LTLADLVTRGRDNEASPEHAVQAPMDDSPVP